MVGVVVLFAGCGGGAAPREAPKPNGSQAQTTAAEVSSLLAGIPQRGNELGNPNAHVTVRYFADLQCPFCRRFSLGLLPSLIQNYVRPGAVKFEFCSYKTATRNVRTYALQQEAALAAGKQNKLWNYVELFYHEQREEDSGYVTESFLQALAQQVPGLDLIAWSAARSDPRLLAKLNSDERAAAESGITSTPSFLLINGTTPTGRAVRKLLSQATKGS